MTDVVCPSCKGSFHTLTEEYDPNRQLTGNMLTVKPEVAEKHWHSFQEVESTKVGQIECPRCGTLYMRRGKLKLREEGAAPIKKGRIPESVNSTILQLNEAGKTPTEIGDHIGYSRQAVGRRIYDLKKKDE